MTLGEIISTYRREHHMSMDQFAAASGLSKSYISMLERNRTHRGECPSPSIETYHCVAKVLGTEAEELIRTVSGKAPLPPAPVHTTEDVVTFRVNVDIAAGYDQPASPLTDWEGASIDVPTSALHGRPQDDFFAIRITGSSMYPNYQDGDFVLVQKADTLDYSGQVGVMLCGDEGTIKKVEYVEGEAWLRLIPFNLEYAPRTIEGADLEQCRVIGIPKLLIRNL